MEEDVKFAPKEVQNVLEEKPVPISKGQVLLRG